MQLRARRRGTDVYSLVIQVGAAISDGSTFALPLTVSSPTPDPNPANNTATASSTVMTSADLDLVVTGPSTVETGTNAPYSFVVFNGGPSVIVAPFFTLMGLPTGFSEVALAPAGTPNGDLLPGSTAVYNFVEGIASNVSDGRTVNFTTQVNGGVTDPNPANNLVTTTQTTTTHSISYVGVSIASSATAPTVGTTVTFTATVAPVTSGGPTPTGTVTFTSDGTSLGTVNVGSDGTASIPAPGLAVGNHTVIASYNGDPTYVPTTGVMTQVVKAIVPSTVIPTFGKVKLPTAVVAGGKLNAALSVVLTNGGDGLTGAFTVALFANTTPTLDGNQVQVASMGRQRFSLLLGKHTAFNFKLQKFAVYAAGWNLLPDCQRHGSGQFDVNFVATTQTVQSGGSLSSLCRLRRYGLRAAGNDRFPPTNPVPSVPSVVTNNGNTSGNRHSGINAPLPPLPTDRRLSRRSSRSGTVSKHANIAPGKSSKVVLHFKHPAGSTTGSFFPFVDVMLDGEETTGTLDVQFTLL